MAVGELQVEVAQILRVTTVRPVRERTPVMGVVILLMVAHLLERCRMAQYRHQVTVLCLTEVCPTGSLVWRPMVLQVTRFHPTFMVSI